jgi:hypothetical protein
MLRAMGLFAKVFGDPTLSAEQQAAFEAEGVVEIVLGVHATKIYRHFRAPGRRTNYDRRLTRANVVLTQQRLVVLEGKTPFVDCPWTDPRFATIATSVEDDALVIVIDPSAFHDDWSGSIEMRLRTERAAPLLDQITHRRG